MKERIAVHAGGRERFGLLRLSALNPILIVHFLNLSNLDTQSPDLFA